MASKLVSQTTGPLTLAGDSPGLSVRARVVVPCPESDRLRAVQKRIKLQGRASVGKLHAGRGPCNCPGLVAVRGRGLESLHLVLRCCFKLLHENTQKPGISWVEVGSHSSGGGALRRADVDGRYRQSRISNDRCSCSMIRSHHPHLALPEREAHQTVQSAGKVS